MRLLGLWLLVWVASEGLGATVVFSPSGSGAFKKVRQAKARFSEPMVAFGDLRQGDPFEVKCSQPGKGRWLDPQNWVYDFKEELPAGVRCEFKVKSGLKALKGGGVKGATYRFSTGGPVILRSRPYSGSDEVAEDQVFVLTLDAPVDPKSVERFVGFQVEGIPQPVGVRLVEGGVREEILDAAYVEKDQRARVLTLQARQRFPAGAKLVLVWGAGVATPEGVATESPDTHEYQVRGPFRAEFSCERSQAEAPCIPLSQMVVRFSSPVPAQVVEQVSLTGPKGELYKAERYGGEDNFLEGVRFLPPFPPAAKFTLKLPPGIKDDLGRELSNGAKFPLEVGTDEFPPLAKFPGTFGVIEQKAGALLPVTVRNVEKELKGKVLAGPAELSGAVHRVGPEQAKELWGWLRHIGWAGGETSVFQTKDGEAPPSSKPQALKVPRKEGEKALEVVGIPLKKPGFYVVQIESPRLGASLLQGQTPYHVPTGALVTNLGVHFKWGQGTSVAWVTELDSGTPVAGAKVKVWDCHGKLIQEVVSDKSGVGHLKGIPQSDDVPKCTSDEGKYSTYNYGLIVTAEKGEDFSFVHTEWDRGIERWRYSVPYGDSGDSTVAHAVTDRSLFRAGETAHLKIYLRSKTSQGLEEVAAAKRPAWLRIQHEGTEEKFHVGLKWGAAGAVVAEWKIPKEAKLGAYALRLVDSPKARTYDGLSAGRFRVEEYRVPLMRALLEGPGDNAIQPSSAKVNVQVSYLSGGGAGGLPVKMRTRIETAGWGANGFDEWNFLNGAVKVGKRESGDESNNPQPEPVTVKELTLDKSGAGTVEVGSIPRKEVPQGLYSEVEYTDPNGEIQTVGRTFRLMPSALAIAVKPDGWAQTKSRLRFSSLVLDLKGKPVAGKEVALTVYQQATQSHRKRLLGGYYTYQHSTETKKVGELCRGKTDDRGRLDCEGKVEGSGNYLVQGETKDGEGRLAVAHGSVWVAGSDDWWFETADHDRMDLLPEKVEYQPGEKAKFQVRMPFREGTALVAVEREGVVNTFVRKLSGKDPVVEVPVTDDYAPNVFVSVLVVRGRVGGVKPTGLVDLGRPAFKLGIAEIRVGAAKHRLKVDVKAEKEVYRVREKVRVTIAASAQGKLPAGAEAMVAVVDEGLLELSPNLSWNLLDAMLGRRSYGISTSTAQMHVVGRRHFGLKAQPPGGGGGAGSGSTRELFDTLVYWNGRVNLDKSGRAQVEFPLNDSLTSFRVVAVVSAGADRFGTGATSIRATQDLMVMPGIPPLARVGDKLNLIVTVRNTTAQKREVRLSASVSGGGGKADALPAQRVDLGPEEAKEVVWPYTIPTTEELLYRIHADGGSAKDSVAVRQTVLDPIPVRVLQATTRRVEGDTSLPVEVPKDADPKRGGLTVRLSPTLAASLDGVKEYMQRYPFSCFEQRTSKAVALENVKEWKALMKRMGAYLDSEGFIKYFPQADYGSDVLTAYVVAMAAATGWGLPEAHEERLLKALEGFAQGAVVRSHGLRTPDLPLRRVGALSALVMNGKRVPKPSVLASLGTAQEQWPTSALLDWLVVLKKVEPEGKRIGRARELLRARVALQGTTLSFTSEKSDAFWWLMTSGDSNAVRALYTLIDEGDWKDDVPRLVLGTVGRMKRGRWDLTTANAWGVLALKKFGRQFESKPVGGETLVTLQKTRTAVPWSKKPAKAVELAWPLGPASLGVKHQGTGNPWATFISRAAIPLKEPLFAGYQVEKEIVPVEQKEKGRWSRGDLARVKVKLRAQADMGWVVVSDPVPAGAAILGGALDRGSKLGAEGDSSSGDVWGAFDERSFEAFRRYFEYVPEGTSEFSYTMRLNNPGRFVLSPTRVEAMYSPEMFGELPNAVVEVSP